MRVIALDPATKMGFALEPGHHGTIDLSPRPLEIESARCWRAYCAMIRLGTSVRWCRDETIVVVEGSMGFSRGMAAIRVANEIRGAIKVWCGRHGVPLIAVAPATIKKFATEDGRASKAQMVQAARDRWGYEGRSDDEADAIAVRAWALHMGWDALMQRIARKHV